MLYGMLNVLGDNSTLARPFVKLFGFFLKVMSLNARQPNVTPPYFSGMLKQCRSHVLFFGSKAR